MPYPHGYLAFFDNLASGILASVEVLLTAINNKLPALGPKAAALSISVTQTDYYTPVEVAAGGGVFNVTTLAAGGAGSSFWALQANAVYELRCDPAWSGGVAKDSDSIRGVFKLDGAPANDDDGDYIRTGERVRICRTVAGTVHVRAHNLAVAGLWKLHRRDA